MENFINYSSTSELHTELTNIVLLCIEDSNSDYYCYCNEEKGDCDLCNLIDFIYDIDDKNMMDGLSPRKFLQFNYNNRLKLEEFAEKILPFFEKMRFNNPESLNFFERRYTWSMRDFSEGTYHSLTLAEVIENEKELVDNNPQLYNI